MNVGASPKPYSGTATARTAMGGKVRPVFHEAARQRQELDAARAGDEDPQR